MEKTKQSLSLWNFQKPINTGLSLASSVFTTASCAKKELNVDLESGLDFSCHVPSLPDSPCSVGSLNKPPVDQLWWKKDSSKFLI